MYMYRCVYIYSPPPTATHTLVEPYRIKNQDSCQISDLECASFKEGEMMSEIKCTKLQSQYQKESFVIIGTGLYSVIGRSFY